jgi:predicted dehydrogenase
MSVSETRPENEGPYRLRYAPKMPRRRKVPIGCIGSGFIMADCHLVAYRNAGFNPVAITSRTFANAERVAKRHGLQAVESVDELLDNRKLEVIDIAVPPDQQLPVLRKIVQRDNIRGILAQKPLGFDLAEAQEAVQLCRDAGIVLAVNQNMRYDQSVRAAKDLLQRGVMGPPVLATIDMRAIPHWMPWQESLNWLTLRIMSIHHLDTFRYWFGDPDRVYASVRPDPRTKFEHTDGICLYILEYDDNDLRASSWDDVWAGPAREGAAEDIGIRWRIECERGMARGTIGWPKYPRRQPSTLDYTTTQAGKWFKPRWKEVWFPDAFVGTMAQLLVAIEKGEEPEISGEDNLKTMALVEAAYRSAAEKRAISPRDMLPD